MLAVLIFNGSEKSGCLLLHLGCTVQTSKGEDTAQKSPITTHCNEVDPVLSNGPTSTYLLTPFSGRWLLLLSEVPLPPFVALLVPSHLQIKRHCHTPKRCTVRTNQHPVIICCRQRATHRWIERTSTEDSLEIDCTDSTVRSCRSRFFETRPSTGQFVKTFSKESSVVVT